MRFEIAATIPLNIEHHSIEGVLHSHSLTVEAWTAETVCLDAWREEIAHGIAYIECGRLEDTIGGRTFEDIAAAVLTALPAATRAVIRLPELGHAVEVCR